MRVQTQALYTSSCFQTCEMLVVSGRCTPKKMRGITHAAGTGRLSETATRLPIFIPNLALWPLCQVTEGIFFFIIWEWHIFTGLCLAGSCSSSASVDTDLMKLTNCSTLRSSHLLITFCAQWWPFGFDLAHLKGWVVSFHGHALKEIRHFPTGPYTETRGQMLSSVRGTEMPDLVNPVAKLNHLGFPPPNILQISSSSCWISRQVCSHSCNFEHLSEILFCMCLSGSKK